MIGARDWSFRLVVIGMVAVMAAYGASYGLRYWQVSVIDRQGAGTKFQMHQQGTALPATCQIGDTFFDSDATAGQNSYGCTALNTWTLQGDGTGGSASIPTGTIAFFNLGSCPSGWAEYTGLRGRYAVGKLATGTLEGTSGTAFTTDLEARAVGTHNHVIPSLDHNHSITDPGHTHSYVRATAVGGTAGGSGSIFYNSDDAEVTGESDTGITGTGSDDPGGGNVNNTGTVAGTPAPYVQLLACRKS